MLAVQKEEKKEEKPAAKEEKPEPGPKEDKPAPKQESKPPPKPEPKKEPSKVCSTHWLSKRNSVYFCPISTVWMRCQAQAFHVRRAPDKQMANDARRCFVQSVGILMCDVYTASKEAADQSHPQSGNDLNEKAI